MGVASMPSRTSRPRSSPSADAACVSARSARSASLRSLAKRLGGSFNLTVTAEKTEVGVPAPAGTDRYVDCMQLCPNDANGRDDRNARVRLAAQGLERIGRREVGLSTRPCSRTPLETAQHSAWAQTCHQMGFLVRARRYPCIPPSTAGDRPGAPSFDLSAEGVWSTRVRFG